VCTEIEVEWLMCPTTNHVETDIMTNGGDPVGGGAEALIGAQSTSRPDYTQSAGGVISLNDNVLHLGSSIVWSSTTGTPAFYGNDHLLPYDIDPDSIVSAKVVDLTGDGTATEILVATSNGLIVIPFDGSDVEGINGVEAYGSYEPSSYAYGESGGGPASYGKLQHVTDTTGFCTDFEVVDINGDTIPDIVAVYDNGYPRVHYGVSSRPNVFQYNPSDELITSTMELQPFQHPKIEIGPSGNIYISNYRGNVPPVWSIPRLPDGSYGTAHVPVGVTPNSERLVTGMAVADTAVSSLGKVFDALYFSYHGSAPTMQYFWYNPADGFVNADETVGEQEMEVGNSAVDVVMQDMNDDGRQEPVFVIGKYSVGGSQHIINGIDVEPDATEPIKYALVDFFSGLQTGDSEGYAVGDSTTIRGEDIVTVIPRGNSLVAVSDGGDLTHITKASVNDWISGLHTHLNAQQDYDYGEEAEYAGGLSVVAPFSGDPLYPDILSGLYIYKNTYKTNTADNGFQAANRHRWWYGGKLPKKVVPGDYNQDGSIDLMVIPHSSGSEAIKILWNQGSGMFSESWRSEIGGKPTYTELGSAAAPAHHDRFSGHKYNDVHISMGDPSGGPNTIMLWLIPEDGSQAALVTSTESLSPTAWANLGAPVDIAGLSAGQAQDVVVGDASISGKDVEDDLFAATKNGGLVIDHGLTGVAGTQQISKLGSNIEKVALFDMDADGLDDVVVMTPTGIKMILRDPTCATPWCGPAVNFGSSHLASEMTTNSFVIGDFDHNGALMTRTRAPWPGRAPVGPKSCKATGVVQVTAVALVGFLVRD
jgi:hypothetical protein